MEHIIQNEALCAVISERGAELRSLRGHDGTEYLWQGDAHYWPDRAPNIFPYVARLTGGVYEMDGEQYSLPIHGFAPVCRFVPAQQAPDGLTLVLRDNEETFRLYPRHFIFSILYRVISNVLSVTCRVENCDTRTLHFGIGGHPGFRVPMEAGLDFSDYRLLFSDACQPQRIGFTEDCFLDGTTVPFPLADDIYLPLTHSLFDRDAVVLKNTARQVTLCAAQGRRGVMLTFPDAPYLGIWHTPHTKAPYICIEPWSSLPATAGHLTVLENQSDLIHLKPGGVYTHRWTICIL